ncbi:MAG: T9SS type A sorting domain-containing protein, partial [Flavobacteriales bacterium]|nr:T9SS type A sorting domain-containing protein [Flavobacteriales bacterium]
IAITEDISNLAAAKYLVTITDGNSCSIVDSIIVAEPRPLVYTDSLTPINCGGDSSGAVILTVSGGTTLYTYNWTNGESTATIDSLKIGTYAVTITDNNGCSQTNSYSLTQPTAFRLFVSLTDITCNGLANGTAVASTIGGSGSKVFVWRASTSSATIATTASVSNLSLGKYYVIATDSLGCSQIDSVDIAEPSLLIATLDSSNLTCNGDFSGSIDLIVSGGTTPYTFNWNSSISSATIAITEDILNLEAARYFVTITDGNNCQIIDSTTISQADTIALVASIQQVFCAADSSGTIALITTGGTQPYSYAWSNGASVDFISKLIAGTYSVTLSDANSCSETATYQLTEPSVLSILLNASTVSCGGDSTGMIASVVSGGVAPYMYAWSTSTSSVIISTADSIQNLKASTYYLTVSDANGCQLLDTTAINENSSLQAALSKTDISCNGSADGTLNVTVSGGTTPYSYHWNDLSTSQNRNNLNAGNYLLTVSDNLACSVVLLDTIFEPSVITVMADTNNVTCSGAGNASIKLSVSGGLAPYSYNWSNSLTTDSIGGLAGGTYLVTITDQNSCSTTRSYRLTNPDPIQLNATVANIGCGSSAKGGSIRLAATGGTSPYTFTWSNGETTAINDSLGVGNYSLSLTDASGCVSSADFTIQLEGNPIFARYLSASFATSDDTISFVNLSYPSPASYTWDLGDSTILNQTDVLHSYRSRRVVEGDSSFYDVRLLADNGTCVDSVNKRITIRNLGPLRKGLDSISRYDVPFIEEVNLYPVPAKNVLNYKLLLGLEDEMTVRIYTLDQKLLKTYNLSKAKEHEGKFRVAELAKGLYIITFSTSTDQQSIRFIKM